MLSEKIIAFNKLLDFKGTLPLGIRMMNPYKEDAMAMSVSSDFYRKYYNDTISRYLILGINPGRFGGGITGIPFTDPKRLTTVCGIKYDGVMTHEPSSVFIYDMIAKYGGASSFYKKFYISAICPLGFTAISKTGREVNYNYYDMPDLLEAVYEFIIESLRKQISFGINTSVCFCLGGGKNYKFLQKVNAQYHFFQHIIPLEHPRYIMQYKSKSKEAYLTKYLEYFNQC